MTTNRKANFQRHNRGKQASLTWDDGTLDHGAAHALAELMDRTAAPALRAMYNHHRDQLRQHRRKGQHDVLLQDRGGEGHGGQRFQQHRLRKTQQVNTQKESPGSAGGFLL